MGKIYYLMGKSASGKDHIYENLIQETALDLKPFVLYTTRPIRSGEQDGREYFFVDEKRLSELREAGKIIEERMYSTVQGPWYYFTADDGQIDLAKHDYLGIGTLESYLKLKAYFGEQAMVPLYVEVDDGLRLSRALERERKQTEPKYAEMCRRFLADCEDFTEEKIAEAGIVRRFSKVARLVDEYGSAVILKNNIPRYLVIDFSKAEQETTASEEDVLSISKRLMEQNKEAYEVLAK